MHLDLVSRADIDELLKLTAMSFHRYSNVIVMNAGKPSHRS